MKSTILSLLCICVLGIAATASDAGKINYSTHLTDVFLHAIAADARGNVYVTGSGRNSGIFVAKLDRKGRVAYSTYIDQPPVVGNAGRAIAVDFEGNAYVTGITSGGLPATPGAFQKEPGGSTCGVGDAFVVKLDDEGELVYTTYLGGQCLDYGTAIAVDLSGNAYVTGLTTGAFPTTPSTINNNTTCAEFCGFVAKLDATGSSLVYSDYLGQLDVNPGGIAVDLFGNAYVTGTATIFTTTPNSFEPDLLSFENFEPFVAKIDSAGDSFVYSTYLAGQVCNPTCLGVWGHGLGIAVDLLGHAYVTGTTMNGFPTTPNVVQPIFGGNTDAFVAKLNKKGTGLIYSTYLGGVPAEWGVDIEVDLRGNAYVLWGSVTGALDAKVSRLNATGSSFINFAIGSQQSVGNVSSAIDYSG